MSTDIVRQATQAIGIFAQMTRQAIKDNPDLAEGTPENLIATVKAATVLQFYEGDDYQRAS